jgi:hypothetical protein
MPDTKPPMLTPKQVAPRYLVAGIATAIAVATAIVVLSFLGRGA